MSSSTDSTTGASAAASRKAARREAAMRRNAHRGIDEDEDDSMQQHEEEKSSKSYRRRGVADGMSTSASSDTRLIGRSLESDPTKAKIQSSHDERRAINAMIYGRLNQIDNSEFVPQTFRSSRLPPPANATAAASASSTSSIAGIAAASSSSAIVPAASSSSASFRVQQRPEDFMDDEDRRGAHGEVASASSGMRIVATPVNSQTMIQLLKSFGWRAQTNKQRTGAAPDETSSSDPDAKPGQKRKLPGPELPPGMIIADETLQPDAQLTDAQAYHMMQEDEAAESEAATQRKTDTHGLGFLSSKLSSTNLNSSSGITPLTFVRAKRIDTNSTQPKVYTINVPQGFDGRHKPIIPPSPPIQPASMEESISATATAATPSNVIQQWRMKMDAERRSTTQDAPPRLTSLPLPPMPPPHLLAAPPSAPSNALSSSSSALDAHAAHLQRLQQQQEQRRLGLPAHLPSTSSVPISTQQPPPLIDIRAAIAAAAANVATQLAERANEERKQTRKARWGPLPTEAAQSFPLAAAFMSKLQSTSGIDPASSVPAAAAYSLPLPLPPPPPHASISLAQQFPRFVEGETQNADAEASGTTTSASDPLAASSSSHAPFDPTASLAIESKFATADSLLASDTTESTQKSIGPIVAPLPTNSYDAAARMKMFGKLTREISDWTPHPLVYKRFGVPAPSRLAPGTTKSGTRNRSSASSISESTGITVPGFPSFVESTIQMQSTHAGGIIPPLSGSNNNPIVAATPVVSDEAEEQAMQAQLMMANEDEDDNNNNDSEVANTKVGPSSHMETESSMQRDDDAPSIDLFRAIFESEDPVVAPTKLNPAPPNSTLSASLESLFSSSDNSTQSHHMTPHTQVVQPAPQHTKVEPQRTAPSSAASISSSKRQQRDVISIDDDDEEDADGDIELTGFTQSKPKIVPSSFRSTTQLEFVPPSSRPQGKRQKHDKSSSSSLSLLRDRMRVNEEEEDDDIYDVPFNNAKPPSTASTSFESTRFVPPPVRPAAPVVLPAVVPQSWPFPRITPSSSQHESLPRSASASEHKYSTATHAASSSLQPSPPPTSALLAHLLELRQQRKKEKKHKSKKKSDKSMKQKKSKKKKKKSKAKEEDSSSSSTDGSESDE